MAPYYVYILECSDGSYYTGIARYLDKRLAAHQSGKGSRYVASRSPFTMVYTELLESKSAALKREIKIKEMTHSAKAQLVNSLGLCQRGSPYTRRHEAYEEVVAKTRNNDLGSKVGVS